MGYLAGSIVDAADFVHTSSTAPGTAATNFTDLGSTAVRWGPVVFLHIYVQTTNALTASSGNIADVTIWTAGTSWRPPVTVNAVMGNGLVDGEVQLTAAGVVQIRAADYTVSAGSSMRCTFNWVDAPA